MADVEAFVWYDLDGNITAVGHAVGDRAQKIESLVRDDRRVLKVTIAYEHLPKIHLTHNVDLNRAALSPRRDKTATSV